MKNILSITILFFLSINFTNGQGFAKLKQDTNIKGQKFYKDEIFPMVLIANGTNSNRFIVDSDTLDMGSNIEALSSEPDLTKENLKNKFVRLKDSVTVRINVSSIINGKDVIKLINGEQKLSFINDSTKDLPLKDIDESFRLIIPNTPTIFYAKVELAHDSVSIIGTTNPSDDQDGDKVNDNDDSCKNLKGPLDNHGCPLHKPENSGLPWWLFILIGLIAGVIGFLLGKYLKDKKNVFAFLKKFKSAKGLSTQSVKYTKGFHGSIVNFINTNGGIKTIRQLNKHLKIPKNVDELDRGQQKKLEERLADKDIIIPLEIEPKKPNPNEIHQKGSETEDLESPKDEKRKSIRTGNSSDDGDIGKRLSELQTSIIGEVRKMVTQNNKDQEVDSLKKEVKDLKVKLDGTELKIEKNRSEFVAQTSELEKNNKILSEQKDQIQRTITDLSDRVVIVDFLREYAEKVISFFDYCNDVSNDAYTFLNRIPQNDTKQAAFFSHLIIKYQSRISNVPIGNWRQITSEIKETGASTYRQLIRSFSQIQSNADKQKEFMHMLFANVLINYSGNLLILAEEFRNIEKFQPEISSTYNTNIIFSKHVSEILTRANAIGITLKYVPLFGNWEKYLNLISDRGDERSQAYLQISGLKKDDIAEVVSIGIKTDFDDTQTIVILA